MLAKWWWTPLFPLFYATRSDTQKLSSVDIQAQKNWDFIKLVNKKLFVGTLIAIDPYDITFPFSNNVQYQLHEIIDEKTVFKVSPIFWYSLLQRYHEFQQYYLTQINSAHFWKSKIISKYANARNSITEGITCINFELCNLLNHYFLMCIFIGTTKLNSIDTISWLWFNCTLKPIYSSCFVVVVVYFVLFISMQIISSTVVLQAAPDFFCFAIRGFVLHIKYFWNQSHVISRRSQYV